MGEQGAESIHAHMNKMESTYSGISNALDRLKYIVKEQALESAPSLTNLRPVPQKRQKRAADSDDEDDISCYDVDSQCSDLDTDDEQESGPGSSDGTCTDADDDP